MNEPNATTTATGSDVENILVSVSKHDLNKLEAAYARSLDRIEKLETALWDERLSALDVDDGLVAALARVARLEAALRGVEWGNGDGRCPWCGGLQPSDGMFSSPDDGHAGDCALYAALGAYP